MPPEIRYYQRVLCAYVPDLMVRKLKLHELNRLSPDEFQKREKIPVVLILDNIRSGLNVGAAFRTADAFATERVILCGITATPPHREILKTSLGASETVKWDYQESAQLALQELKASGYKLFAVEQTDCSTSLDAAELHTNKVAFIFGNEVEGVSEALLPLCDSTLEIPQFGTKHSLNVATSIGIVLWEVVRQRIHKGKRPEKL